jgi:hypothetical protein
MPPAPRPGAGHAAPAPGDAETTMCLVREVFVDLKPRHYSTDGIEVIDVAGEIDVATAPQLRALLSDLTSKNSYQLVVNLAKVEFLDSSGVGSWSAQPNGYGPTTAPWNWSAPRRGS